MPSDVLKLVCDGDILTLISEPAEEVDFPKVHEVWLFNVLQHVLDPDIIIAKAKKAARIIRFFEPINLPTDKMHHWSFSMQWFEKRFGDCVRHYGKHPYEKHFHQWENCYGIWTK